MSEPQRRRPLPALVCLVALTLLTALVWWRVLNRDSGTAQAKNKTCTPAKVTTLPHPTRVAVTVLNSTTRAGLAKTTAAKLSHVGFKVSGYGNDTGHAAIPGVAEIRYTPDEKLSATLVSYYFPGASQVVLNDGTQGKLVVSLGVKYKSIPAPASVQSAMRSAGVTVAPRTAAPSPAPTTTCTS